MCVKLPKFSLLYNNVDYQAAILFHESTESAHLRYRIHNISKGVEQWKLHLPEQLQIYSDSHFVERSIK